jgi:hypothetical protein
MQELQDENGVDEMRDLYDKFGNGMRVRQL